MSDITPYDPAKETGFAVATHFQPIALRRLNEKALEEDDHKMLEAAVKANQQVIQSADNKGGTMTHFVIEIVAGAASQKVEITPPEVLAQIDENTQLLDADDPRPAEEPLPEMAVFDLGALLG